MPRWVYFNDMDFPPKMGYPKRCINNQPSKFVDFISYFLPERMMTEKRAKRKHDEAIVFHKKAISLNPFRPSVYLRNLGTAYHMSGRYHEAVAEFKKSLKKNPDDSFAHLGLAICYGSLALDEEARAEAAEVLRTHPEFSLSYFAETLPYKKQSEVDEAIASRRRTVLK